MKGVSNGHQVWPEGGWHGRTGTARRLSGTKKIGAPFGAPIDYKPVQSTDGLETT